MVHRYIWRRKTVIKLMTVTSLYYNLFVIKKNLWKTVKDITNDPEYDLSSSIAADISLHFSWIVFIPLSLLELLIWRAVSAFFNSRANSSALKDYQILYPITKIEVANKS